MTTVFVSCKPERIMCHGEFNTVISMKTYNQKWPHKHEILKFPSIERERDIIEIATEI